MEQAIEAGIIPPSYSYPGHGGAFDGLLGGGRDRQQRDFGAKPEMFERWVGRPVEGEEARWEGIQVREQENVGVLC